MADKDFIVKNGIVSGTNTLTVGTALTVNTTGVYHNAGTINAASHTVGTSTVANSTGVYTGIVNGSSITVGSSTISNSSGVYTTTVNAASYTIGSSYTANSSVVNATSYTVGTSTIANSTGVYTGVVNGSTISVGSSFAANSSGVYHTGTVNAASHTVGTSTVANSSGVYATTVNASSHTVGSSTVANSSGVYAAVVNATTGFYGTVLTATQGTINHDSLANYDANKHVDHTSVSISTANGVAGGGTIASTRNLYVVANNGVVANSTGVWAKQANGTSVDAGGINVLAGNSELVSNSSGVWVGSAVARRADVHYVGTTSIALNRGSGSQTLTGVSIDGNAATVTNGLYTTGGQTISGGFVLTPYNLGTQSGTLTPSATNGNYQYMLNGGALTINNPTSDCAIDILVSNIGASGSITFSGYTAPSGGGGDTYSSTDNLRFLLSIRRLNGISTYVWKALQ